MSRLPYNILGIVVALALWELLGRMAGVDLFAPPSMVLVEYAELVREGRMFVELGTSLRQMVVGFGAACLIGIPVGIVMGRSWVLDSIFHPWLSMFVVTSVAALAPLLVLIFGSGFWFRVVIVFLASVWYVVLTVYHGARGVEPRFIHVGRSFGAGRLQSFLFILLPALYPYIVAGVRIGLVHAIRAMVVAEMFIILGYGGLLYRAGYSTTTAPLLALLITLMLVGIAANEALRLAGRKIAPWYDERMGHAGAPPGQVQ
jgi:ABC-type nitrate/sulfonate/bicarbonate transport system permease component